MLRLNPFFLEKLMCGMSVVIENFSVGINFEFYFVKLFGDSFKF